MLLKTLKYDLRSVWRIWWIMAVSVVGASLVGGAALRTAIFLIEEDKFPFFVFTAFLLVFACFMAIMASVIITEILIYIRFYKNFFTDEGYLTFTLPVSRKTLFLSKTLNAMIWGLSQGVLTILGFCMIILIGIPAELMEDFYREIHWLLSMLWSEIGGWIFVYALELLVLLIFSMVFSVSLIHFCITLGCTLVKKAKVITSIGIYYLVNMVLSFSYQIFVFIFTLVLSRGLEIIVDSATPIVQNSIFAVLLLLICAMMAMLAGVMYFITLNCMERKLNLA